MTPPTSRRSYRAERRAVAQTRAARSRAGRDLPAAVGVGVGLGALVLGTLLFWEPGFVVFVTLAITLGAWELLAALQQGRVRPPTVPTLLGAAALVPLTYVAGGAGLAVGYGVAVLAVLVWRSLDPVDGAVRDIAGGVFILTYLPLPASFTSLLLLQDDGHLRIVVFVVVVVTSDIGGYATGVVFGRHPLAPSASPKKSWEGFAGSVLWCVVSGALTVSLLLDGPWWAGAAVGAAAAVFATVGDLAESTMKRDLGVKDMGRLLPGHGGVMDRLDSLLACAPVTWLLLTLLVPA